MFPRIWIAPKSLVSAERSSLQKKKVAAMWWLTIIFSNCGPLIDRPVLRMNAILLLSGYLSLWKMCKIQENCTFCMDSMDYRLQTKFFEIDCILYMYYNYFWKRYCHVLQYALESYWHSTTLFDARSRVKVWDESIKGCLFVWGQVTSLSLQDLSCLGSTNPRVQSLH